jgi:hypothetical protein
MRRATAIVIATSIAFACSKYDEGDDATPAPDRPQDDAAVEAAPPEDAATTADVVDASAPCVGWDFCDDFERDLPDMLGWQTVALGGTVAIDREVRFTGDRSLRCAVVNNGTEATAYVQRALPDGRRRAEAELAMRFETLPSAGMNLLVVYYNGGSAYTLVDVAPGGTVLLQEWRYFGDGGVTFTSVEAGTITAGSFVHMILDVDLTTARASLTIGTAGATLLLATPTAQAVTAFAVGIEYSQPQNATVWVDDLKLR